MGSSFLYTRAADGGDAPAWLGRWTAWGQTAETRFDGADGPLSVHGEVATATVGVDTRRDRWLAGVAVSYSLGDGAYNQAQAGGGTLASTLASVSPFARFELNERTSLWGVFGHGAGRLSLRPDRAAAPMETDLTNTMTAFGGRTALSDLAGRTPSERRRAGPSREPHGRTCPPAGNPARLPAFDADGASPQSSTRQPPPIRWREPRPNHS